MWYNPPNEERRNRFHAGQCFDAYNFLGAHPVEEMGDMKWHFSVWAPNARAVSLVGEFCSWDVNAYPMQKQFDGIWELRLPDKLFTPDADPNRFNYPEAKEKLRAYKYAVLCADDGQWHLRADPYGFESELRPHNASRLHSLENYKWHDQKWIENRGKWDPYHSPINIYEMHLGTWRRGEEGRILTYSEVADQLIPYIREMGYTHVELLPVMEHPFDGSWGYQVTGYYAPTARYGQPDQFRDFVDRLHQASIGVILDWVPAHFPRDEIGLRRFDGTPCYEHQDPRRGEMPQWGTMLFDYGRGEVSSFLLSNAVYWCKEYHADGLRCDAVSCMLYHDFAKEPGQWVPNKDGGRENLEAIAFIKQLNETVYRECPGVMMIAEEATAFPGVTHPTDKGGLGFGFKWNMGWMNDMLSYIKLDPVYRSYHHDKLTFSLMYAFSENYILPFSHDEVVHGKHSMLDKQPGDIWRKFAGLRALYGYTMAHPGKKLLFMGSEFGHYIEWKDDDQLDWFLLLYEKHPEMQKYVKALNHLYRETPALHKQDDSWSGFTWLAVNDNSRSIVGFMRMAGRHTPIASVTNFTPQPYGQYRIGVPYDCELTELLNSDRAEFAGSNQYNAAPIRAEKVPCENHPYSCVICVPPLATVYFKVRKISRRQLAEEKAMEKANATPKTRSKANVKAK
ncbi:MAG: 1,4-alpha-glucan branching protein GlgB [Clostridia bacterium]|nr:1,4-alpha-glucan branching protein GlgB [Clostridia bacterium]